MLSMFQQPKYLLLHTDAANRHSSHTHNRNITRFSQARYKKALLFVDNAGSDVVLGMLPFARELLKLGVKVRVHRTEGIPFSLHDFVACIASSCPDTSLLGGTPVC